MFANPAAVCGVWAAMKLCRLASRAVPEKTGFVAVFSGAGALVFGVLVAADIALGGKFPVGVLGSGCAKLISAFVPPNVSGDDASAKSKRWDRLLPLVITWPDELKKVSVPSAPGSGSQGGVVAALAATPDVAITPPATASTAAPEIALRRLNFILRDPFLLPDRGDLLGRSLASLPCHFSRAPSGLRKLVRELVLDC